MMTIEPGDAANMRTCKFIPNLAVESFVEFAWVKSARSPAKWASKCDSNALPESILGASLLSAYEPGMENAITLVAIEAPRPSQYLQTAKSRLFNTNQGLCFGASYEIQNPVFKET
jgi:hypothetical protein